MTPRDRFFKDTLTFGAAHGGEHEVSLIITYRYTPGYPDSRDEPGQPDSVEIIRTQASFLGTLVDVPYWIATPIEADEGLLDRLVVEAREQDQSDADDAAERRHEERRDEIRNERRAA